MPIEMDGRIIWVDCADEEKVPKSDKNNLLLDFPAPVINSPGPSTNSTNQTSPTIGNKVYILGDISSGPSIKHEQAKIDPSLS